MNLQHTPPNIAYAIQQGWIKPAAQKLSPVLTRHDKRRAKFRAAGLTTRGTPPKPKGIKPEITATAGRDGVTVQAIYNRLARTGRMTLRKEKP